MAQVTKAEQLNIEEIESIVQKRTEELRGANEILLISCFEVL